MDPHVNETLTTERRMSKIHLPAYLDVGEIRVHLGDLEIDVVSDYDAATNALKISVNPPTVAD